MSTKTDALERIADALDGGGDFGQGTPSEIGYLSRIATSLENMGGDSGSVGGSVVVTITDDVDEGTSTLSLTYAQLLDAFTAGKHIVVIAKNESDEYVQYPVTSISDGTSAYTVTINEVTYTAESEDDYPVYTVEVDNDEET